MRVYSRWCSGRACSKCTALTVARGPAKTLIIREQARHHELGVHPIAAERGAREAQSKGGRVVLLHEGELGVVREHPLEAQAEIDPVAQRRRVHDEMRDEIERRFAGLLGDVKAEGLVAREIEGARLEARELRELQPRLAGLETRGVDLRRPAAAARGSRRPARPPR